jgi:hypothetical protein
VVATSGAEDLTKLTAGALPHIHSDADEAWLSPVDYDAELEQ